MIQKALWSNIMMKLELLWFGFMDKELENKYGKRMCDKIIVDTKMEK